MNRFFAIVGKLFFPRSQDWERQRNARVMVFVVAFSLAFALVIAKVFQMMYNSVK
jgi:hypothetical protein